MRHPDHADCVIDTHTWLWASTGDDRKIGRRARRRIAEARTVHVPAICQWEITNLVTVGGVSVDQPLADWLELAGSTERFAIAPLTAHVAAEVAELAAEGFHRDPADRMIYATARVLDLPLLTADARIRAFDRRSRGRRVLWD